MSNPSSFPFTFSSAVRWVVMFLLLALARLSASAQVIAPQFFGINYWNMKAGTAALTDPNAALTNDLRTADLQWVRIGGHRFDTDTSWQNPAHYVAPIQYALSIGAEPLVQVPIKLSAARLAGFISYFQSHGLPVTYWAIGNEPDPSGTAPGGQENATLWSAGSLADEFGYTYSQWVATYKTLATQLKTSAPTAKLVGPDFRLFYEPLISDYYQKFLLDVGVRYTPAGVPLLDYLSFHFYADRPESVMQARFTTLQGYINSANAGGRTTNGSAAPVRLAITEVNAFGSSPAAELKPWDFGTGQFLALMAKQAMQRSALCFIPWSIYESNANQGSTDYSLYSGDGSAAAVARRSTMWHLALLSNYRQATYMPSTQSSEADHVVVLGMKGTAGHTVLILNTQSATSYTYRASLDNVQRGPEAVQIALAGNTGVTRQLSGTIGPRTTILYHLDASGNVLAQLVYATGDTVPRQQLSFNFVNKSTGGYARPQDGGATAPITQYTAADHSPSSLHWLLKPAAPGYFYVLNQYTGNALRPAGSTGTAQLQEDQTMTQEALSPGSLGRTYLQWAVEYTGTGGYYRLRNRASGKYLRPLNGAATADIALTQHTLDNTMTSEQWRFDQLTVNVAAQARALATTAGAAVPAFSVYPNPASSTLTIALPEAAQATLYDLAGRLCRTQALDGGGQVDVQALPAGMYLLTVRTGGGEVFQQKIVKE